MKHALQMLCHAVALEQHHALRFPMFGLRASRERDEPYQATLRAGFGSLRPSDVLYDRLEVADQ